MLALFAQAAGNQNNDFDDLDPEELAIIGAVVFVGFLIWLVISLFFVQTLTKTLYLCRPRNRAMEPAKVWLNLIPGFNVIWFFITVIKVADSLKAEFRERRLYSRDNFGRTLGIVLGVFSLLNCGCYIGGMIPLILFIVYWQKIAEYNRRLAARYDDDDDEDYQDEDEDDSRDDDHDDYERRHHDRR